MFIRGAVFLCLVLSAFTIAQTHASEQSSDDSNEGRKIVTDDDLKLSGDLTANSADSSAPSADPELARIFSEGVQAFQKRDITTAAEDFHKVLARDPKFPNAHGYSGLIETMGNRTDVGIGEILKEEEINPKEPYWYSALGSLYATLKREDEAISQWQKLLQIDPKNRDSASFLGQALKRKGRYAEAVQVLESATAESPDSPALHAALGTAYLDAKQLDKAEAAFKKAVELDSSQAMLNRVAYSAADNGSLLAFSKPWAERAVSELEAETAKISLASLQIEDLRRISFLASYWDTLGWVYFRMNDLPAAEKYLHAAWVLNQDSLASDHIGQVYERERKNHEAAHMYELAYATGKTDSETAERYKKLTGRALGDAGSPRLVRHSSSTRVSTPMWPGEELRRMRSIKLPTITTKTVSAEFFVLLSSTQRVEDVKFISGSADLKNSLTRFAPGKIPAEFPDLGPGRIVRRGTLMCGITGCEFTLLLPNSVQSLN